MAFYNYHPLQAGGCDCNLDGGLEGAGGGWLPGVSRFFILVCVCVWGGALIALIEFNSSSQSNASNDLLLFFSPPTHISRRNISYTKIQPGIGDEVQLDAQTPSRES